MMYWWLCSFLISWTTEARSVGSFRNQALPPVARENLSRVSTIPAEVRPEDRLWALSSCSLRGIL